jgi:hypothetical protein
MWLLYPKYLFMSVVDNKQDRTHSTLLVRFRRRKNAEAFLTDFPVAVLRTTPDRDYRYRAVVPKEAMAEIIKKLVEGIDYRNFKDEAFRVSQDTAESVLLHQIWDLTQEHQFGESAD